MKADRTERAGLLAKAVSRCDNDGRVGEGGQELAPSGDAPAGTLPLINAEIVQLQIRVIAIENVLAVLLAEASEHQLQLVRDSRDRATGQRLADLNHDPYRLFRCRTIMNCAEVCPKGLEPVHAIERIRLKIAGVEKDAGGLGVHPPIAPR